MTQPSPENPPPTHPFDGISQDASIQELTEVFKEFNTFATSMEETYRKFADKVEALESQIKEKDEQLERKSRLEALGEMAAGIAHEIKNPLGGLLMHAGMLERDIAKDSQEHRFITRILTAAKHIDDIIKNMLSFTREEAPRMVSTDLADILAQVRMDAAHVAEEKNVALDFSFESTPIYADKAQLRQMILNIVINGIQAAGKGGKVELALRSEAASAEIEIHDTGEGIPQDALSKIFNPFFTLKEKGTGLGLAIVHRIVTAHKGTIKASNHDNGGAVFSITLPLESR
ncbi:MAG: ATP-binding protein [Planctomycetes bacterium]|nr:ATP-binding protein [Planctomycetota bacterium]